MGVNGQGEQESEAERLIHAIAIARRPEAPEEVAPSWNFITSYVDSVQNISVYISWSKRRVNGKVFGHTFDYRYAN